MYEKTVGNGFKIRGTGTYKLTTYNALYRKV